MYMFVFLIKILTFSLFQIMHCLFFFFFGIGTTFQSYNLSMYMRDFIFLSFYSIYTHLLSNHTLYVGCSFGPTIFNSKNCQPHPINQAAYKFYIGVRGLFCVQRTMEEQPHFLQEGYF